MRLKEARVLAMLSQRELSAKSGIAVGTINRVENGLQRPTYRVRRALSKALGRRDIEWTQK